MRIKYFPSDFVVEEILGVNLGSSGAFSVFKVTKKNVTTLQVHTKLAADLGIHRSHISFAGLKDRRAEATQYASIHGNPPPTISGSGFKATHVGRLDRPLRPTDIARNRFSLVLRDLSLEEAQSIFNRLGAISEYGLPNYFDHQRFGSFHPQDGFIGAHILSRDAERAMKSYLSVIYPGDPARIKQFKEHAASQWGNWEAIFQAAPQPSNYRSVLTFLRDHPSDFRRALNLVSQELLSLWLDAYQSYLWNRIVGQFLTASLKTNLDWIEIAGVRLPVYPDLSPKTRNSWRTLDVPLPHHRASYKGSELAGAFEKVMQEENLELADLKARILKKAYTSSHSRLMLLFPQDISIQEPVEDESFTGRKKMSLDFSLPRGCYATLVIDIASIETQKTRYSSTHDEKKGIP